MLNLSPFNSLVEPILARIRQDPEALAFVFMANDGSEQEVSMGRLHGLAAGYARALQRQGIGPDDLVIIAVRFSLDLIGAFLGALYAGATPSIFPHHVPMPDPDTFTRHLQRQVTEAHARAVITEPDAASGLSDTLARAGCALLETDRIETDPDDLSWFPETHTTGEQIAYVQFTSGTTGLQKGVRLSHRAILNWVTAYGRRIDLKEGDTIINWMPLYHDAGLFNGLITPLVYQIPTVLMSPFKFVRAPEALFQAIGRHRGTICWMTNTAMNHAVRVVRDRRLAGLDLRSLRLVGTGGEPVLYETLERFLARFAPYGLCETTLAAAYGLAECTLGASLGPVGRRSPVDWVNKVELQTNQRAIPTRSDAEDARPIVSCGLLFPGTALRIVDAENSPLPDRCVGEIILRTESLFSGYHGRPDLTAQAVRDGWFYTGDLGYLAEGHLYVCGRKKDVIITGGLNIYPNDIEAIANSLPEIYPQRAVAFGVMNEQLGSEDIVLICDLRRRTSEAERSRIERALRQQVFHEVGIALSKILLMKKGWVVLTPNGKVPRSANREKYLRLTARGMVL